MTMAAWLQLHLQNTTLRDRIKFKNHMKALCPNQYDGGDTTTTFLKFDTKNKRDQDREKLIKNINHSRCYKAEKLNDDEIIVKRIRF